ncbi:MAG TPA: TVP38/TMEM64 family protein [Proteobacteria bacterium]|nr:TVP38/TMEM64 family protein [Pseudomonadota bacterium]
MHKYLKPLLFLSLIGCIFILTRFFSPAEFFNEANLRSLLARAGIWAPLLFILFYSLAPVFFLPGLPITLAAGLLFGPFWGVVYAISGATLGATLSFLLARYFLSDWVKGKIASSRFAALYEKSARQGWKLVAFTRLVPLFPFNLLNYAFGVTNISLPVYMLVSFICMLPACIAYVVFGSSLFSLVQGRISPTFLLGIMLILALNLGIILYKKRKAGLDAGRENLL